jgi:hypothetical protein
MAEPGAYNSNQRLIVPWLLKLDSIDDNRAPCLAHYGCFDLHGNPPYVCLFSLPPISIISAAMESDLGVVYATVLLIGHSGLGLKHRLTLGDGRVNLPLRGQLINSSATITNGGNEVK